MPMPAVAAETLAAVRKSPGNRVKVAVADIDGILRGKYIHKDKFDVGGRRRLRLLRRRLRLGFAGPVLRQHDDDRLAQGLSGRARAHRPRHASQRAVGRQRRFLPRRVHQSARTARKSRFPLDGRGRC